MPRICLPKVRATPTREGASLAVACDTARELMEGPHTHTLYECDDDEAREEMPLTQSVGIRELACGSQAFIATLLFDPSMSALPIIEKQNSQSVGLFTRQ